MEDAATAFLDLLDGGRRDAALHDFNGTARTDWHYVPRRRPGLALRDMDARQQAAAWRLIEAALSDEGLRKARGVLELEAVLGELTGRQDFRDPGDYALAVFGAPRADAPWAWRFEGHHLSITFTSVPGQDVAATPSFFGANPAEVPEGHRHAGLRLLTAEHELAFALLDGLSEAQRQRVLLQPRTFGDILTGPGREDSLRRPQGLPLGELPAGQRDLAARLIETYLGRMRADLAERETARLRDAGLERVHFAWAGATAPGAPHYYRLHGPTAVIEYDNTQNGANHVHSVWHDPGNGFGADLLRRHREAAH